MIEVSCGIPPGPDCVSHARLAEELGYERVWLYDSPALYPDIWVSLARIAEATDRIGFGPAVLVPSLRHVMVTANAIATVDGLAPGRLTVAIGTGFTGRMALGQPALTWAWVERYVRQLRGLLAGESVEVDGELVRLMPPTGYLDLPVDVPIRIGANGPKGLAVARELGDGEALGPVRADADRHVDGQVEVARGGHEAHELAVDLDRLAGEQPAELADVALDPRPRERGLAEGHPAGEPGADRDGEPSGREPVHGGDRVRGHHDVTQARHQHGGAESDPVRGLGDARERDPDVGIQRGRVVQPHALVAELLGKTGVADAVRSRRDPARHFDHGHCSLILDSLRVGRREARADPTHLDHRAAAPEELRLLHARLGRRPGIAVRVIAVVGRARRQVRVGRCGGAAVPHDDRGAAEREARDRRDVPERLDRGAASGREARGAQGGTNGAGLAPGPVSYTHL